MKSSLVTLLLRKWLRKRALSSHSLVDRLHQSPLFEQALKEIKSMYEAQFGHLVAEEVVEKDGIEFSVIR